MFSQRVCYRIDTSGSRLGTRAYLLEWMSWLFVRTTYHGRGIAVCGSIAGGELRGVFQGFSVYGGDCLVAVRKGCAEEADEEA